MDTTKIIFTDSGLGGISVMADFARLTRDLDIEIIFFNAQYARNKGYQKMNSKQQVEIFDKALAAMQEKFRANYIAIACNTLSVVFQNSKFKKNSQAKIYDIVETGRKLITKSAYDVIVELAMPTTVNSKVYHLSNKTTVGVGTDKQLADAIESMDKVRIKNILKNAYVEVNNKLSELDLNNKKLALFLGCTHFPLIKDDFLKIAEEQNIHFSELLNPNTEFAGLLFNEIRKKVNPKNNPTKNKIKVVSRIELKDSEVESISKLISVNSPETAQALINYEYIPDLF